MKNMFGEVRLDPDGIKWDGGKTVLMTKEFFPKQYGLHEKGGYEVDHFLFQNSSCITYKHLLVKSQIMIKQIGYRSKTDEYIFEVVEYHD